MVFSFAETAVAAACSPVMEMDAAAMQEMDDTPAPEGNEEERSGDCPFSPAGMTQGCLASASLPASNSPAPAASSDVAFEFSRTEVEPHLLLCSALFHPPKS